MGSCSYRLLALRFLSSTRMTYAGVFWSSSHYVSTAAVFVISTADQWLADLDTCLLCIVSYTSRALLLLTCLSP